MSRQYRVAYIVVAKLFRNKKVRLQLEPRLEFKPYKYFVRPLHSSSCGGMAVNVISVKLHCATCDCITAQLM